MSSIKLRFLGRLACSLIIMSTGLNIIFERFIAKEVHTVLSRTNYKIVPLTNLNKYLYNGKKEIKVNINNYSENSIKHCDCR